MVEVRMRIKRLHVALLISLILLLVSLAYSYEYTWETQNSTGKIAYVNKAAGLPLQFLTIEVSSPVGPSSFVKVDPLLTIINVLFWFLVAYGLTTVFSLKKRSLTSRHDPVPPST
jgi:uncharacterized membrane protein